MTTPAAAAFYLAQHQLETYGRANAVYNPEDRPLEDLTVIYGFNNGGSPGWYSAVLISENGVGLGGHICSDEGYMPFDLGIIEGSRPDRHEGFQKVFPKGYRMEFVPTSPTMMEILQPLFEKNKATAGAGEWPWKGNEQPPMETEDEAG